MKYDEKTGEKQPESRGDELKISFDALETLAKDSKGTFDRVVALEWLLREANMSLALIVDMLALLINRQQEDRKPEKPVQ